MAKIRYPPTIELRCKFCGRWSLAICAYEIGDELAIPVLVCHPVWGCGKVFEFHEYGLIL